VEGTSSHNLLICVLFINDAGNRAIVEKKTGHGIPRGLQLKNGGGSTAVLKYGIYINVLFGQRNPLPL
jgi:hypothetical protein